jgi:hypothetical protein
MNAAGSPCGATQLFLEARRYGPRHDLLLCLSPRGLGFRRVIIRCGFDHVLQFRLLVIGLAVQGPGRRMSSSPLYDPRTGQRF